MAETLSPHRIPRNINIYLSELIEPLGVRVPRIALGIPAGTNFEDAYSVTRHRATDAGAVWGQSLADRSAAAAYGVSKALEANRTARKEAKAGGVFRRIGSACDRFGF